MKRFHSLVYTAAIALSGIPQGFAAVNEKPFTVPEVMEWKGMEGSLSISPTAKIVCNQAVPKNIVENFVSEWKAITGQSLLISEGKAAKGDIVFTLKKDKKAAPEQYTLTVGDKVSVNASSPEGLRWATKTLLQMREQSADLPKGTVIDWPAYPVRGFMMDAGRKYIPLDYLYQLVDAMAYRKMNTLHVHLNDNGFPEYFSNDWAQTQAAFRMESDRFPGLTARDGSYTKREFRDFQKYAESKGVEIIPEFDFPAHSLAFTQYKPEIGSKNKYNDPDHLDLSAPQTYEFLDALLDEYLGGEDPVFTSPHFHIGTDEYKGDSIMMEQFRALTDRYIRTTEKYGKIPAVWGSLTYAKGKTPVKSDGVLMYSWSRDYADPVQMLEEGYDIVSIPDGYVYIVPAAGYYYDYLNTEMLYNDWTPNTYYGNIVGEGNPKMKGGMFAVWNDHPNNGITVKDVHHRVMHALPTMSAKTWNGKAVTVPYADFAAKSARQVEAPGVNYLGRLGQPGETVLEIASVKPGSETGIEEIGYPYAVDFDIEGADEAEGTVLFESPSAKVWIADPLQGNLAFSREGKLVPFRRSVNKGEKMHVRIEGDSDATRLYVDGKLVDNHNIRWSSYPKGKGYKKLADVKTLVFPLAKVGDFKSKVTNLKVTQR